MKSVIYMIFILVGIALVPACQKDPHWILDPSNKFFLQMTHDGKAYTHDQLSQIKCFTMDSLFQRHYDPGFYFLPSIDLDDSIYIYDAAERYNSKLQDQGVLWIASTYMTTHYPNQIKQGVCYLEFPDGDIDTLIVTVETVSQEQGAKELCYCTSPIREVRYNGKILPYKDWPGVYPQVYYTEK